jgi:hypothetical protein
MYSDLLPCHNTHFLKSQNRVVSKEPPVAVEPSLDNSWAGGSFARQESNRRPPHACRAGMDGGAHGIESITIRAPIPFWKTLSKKERPGAWALRL